MNDLDYSEKKDFSHLWIVDVCPKRFSWILENPPKMINGRYKGTFVPSYPNCVDERVLMTVKHYDIN